VIVLVGIPAAGLGFFAVWTFLSWLDERYGLWTVPYGLIRAQVWLRLDFDWSTYSADWQRSQIREAKEALNLKGPRRAKRAVARLVEAREESMSCTST